jgi:hypothetical protein
MHVLDLDGRGSFRQQGGGFKITLDGHTLDRLKALCGPGESDSHGIIRIARRPPRQPATSNA